MFFEDHDPDRLDEVDIIMDSYRKRECQRPSWAPPRNDAPPVMHRIRLFTAPPNTLLG